jgi:hypothetical protein
VEAHNRTAAPEAKVGPKTATERIRANAIDELRDRFEEFVAQGTPEEHRILSDILSIQESSTHGRDAFDELPLGAAMEGALDKYTGDFLRVPHNLDKQVQQYIDCLRAAGCKGVA